MSPQDTRAITPRYIGSGPYCYANCLAMMLADDTEPGLLEVLTGSPFGLQLLGGHRPLFDPVGWDPGIGMDAALALLGWTCERTGGGDAERALSRLRGALPNGPALAGPVEMGLLRHHPGAGQAIGADHYVVVIAADEDLVCFHDPHGHPYATLPAGDFAAAWRAESIGYAGAGYTMRTGLRRVREVAPLDALRASVPAAVTWLHGRPGQGPPGSLGGEEAAVALARVAGRGLTGHGLTGRPGPGLTDAQRGELAWFGIRVGARRLADAEYWLGRIGHQDAARIAGAQARLVGGLQYPLVAGDDATVAAIFLELAPTYRQLGQALAG